jgi:hypothetical protein
MCCTVYRNIISNQIISDNRQGGTLLLTGISFTRIKRHGVAYGWTFRWIRPRSNYTVPTHPVLLLLSASEVDEGHQIRVRRSQVTCHSSFNYYKLNSNHICQRRYNSSYKEKMLINQELCSCCMHYNHRNACHIYYQQYLLITRKLSYRFSGSLPIMTKLSLASLRFPRKTILKR